jgi:uncharacterized protein YndB with AHSA1/START domain
MIDDPIAHAGLVTRTVRTSSRDGAPTRVAAARRSYATDPADLWNALTDPERLPRWFLPVSGDLRVGGRYQTEGNAGGVIEHCEEPTALSLTWEMGPVVSWLTLTLTPTDDGTELELVHEAPVDPDFWEQFGPGAVGVGWDLALMALGLHVATAAPVDPQAGMEFPLTETGTTFVRAAAHGWRDAAIADGDDAEGAAAAAERTVAFYTVLPDEEAPS